MHADVDDALDADQPPRLLAAAAADAAHERVPLRQAGDFGPCFRRHLGQLRPGDDRRQRAVHVEEHGRQGRILAQPRQRILHRPQNTAVRLLAIGLLAGLFSALFGVGGGIVVVPLLILFARYSERPAMGTSLAAIALIALVGSITYALHGEVKPGAAAIVGLPGALGAVAGASLQQRLANRTLSLAFAALLAGLGVWFLV